MVRSKIEYVVKYSDFLKWTNLSFVNIQEINDNLSSLVLTNQDEDESARKFDILTLKFQLDLLNGSKNTNKFIDKIKLISRSLLTKQTIPLINQKSELLNKTQLSAFWNSINAKRVNDLRENLRDIMKFLDKEKKDFVITDFEDSIDENDIVIKDLSLGYNTLQNYKERVESYIKENKLNTTIHKIRTNKIITELDIQELENILFDGQERGTKQDYIKQYGNKPLGAFIRNIVGLEVSEINNIFSDFINAGNLKADQITFINNIISYLTRNGLLEKFMLFEKPFTNINDKGLFGVFDENQAKKIFQIIDTVNKNAIAI